MTQKFLEPGWQAKWVRRGALNKGGITRRGSRLPYELVGTVKRALASCGPRGTCAAIRACARVSVPRVAAPLSSIVIELTSHRSPLSLSLSLASRFNRFLALPTPFSLSFRSSQSKTLNSWKIACKLVIYVAFVIFYFQTTRYRKSSRSIDDSSA